MKRVTRFNPTANGDLHLGHVYTMLVNEYEAHQGGGYFYVRVDDTAIDNIAELGILATNLLAEHQIEDIKWLDLRLDGMWRQSELEAAGREFIGKHNHYIPEYRYPYDLPLNPVMGNYTPKYYEWFPYAPYPTYMKVVYDEIHGVNLLIRGDDLRSEYALYQHFRALLNLPTITHYYIPRIYGPNGEIISKFYGAKSVREYKEGGWSVKDIIDLLAKSALKEPGAGWALSNIKREPRLDPAFFT